MIKCIVLEDIKRQCHSLAFLQWQSTRKLFCFVFPKGKQNQQLLHPHRWWLQVSTSSVDGRTESKLTISKAGVDDRGNYTCRYFDKDKDKEQLHSFFSPSNSAPATVQLFVTKRSEFLKCFSCPWNCDFSYVMFDDDAMTSRWQNFEFWKWLLIWNMTCNVEVIGTLQISWISSELKMGPFVVQPVWKEPL